jgi:hypothetical protein
MAVSDKIKTFHQAAFIGSAPLLLSLLEEGVDVNVEINNVTALHVASGQGCKTCRRSLYSVIILFALDVDFFRRVELMQPLSLLRQFL